MTKTEPAFHSYKDVEQWFDKRRSKSKLSRPFGRFLISLEEDRFRVTDINNHRSQSIVYGDLTQDNKFTFKLTLTDLHRLGFGGQRLFTMLPLHFSRMGAGKFGVKYSKEEITTYVRISDTNEYFCGIAFDIQAGKCLNPKRPYSDRVIPEMRRQWLRDVKAFKQHIKTCERLGVFNKYNTEDWQLIEETPNTVALQQIVDDIKARKVSTQTAKYICAVSWPNEMSRATDTILEMYSLALREAYGVFSNE